MLRISFKIIRKQRVRTIITILAIAISISLPLNVSLVMENAAYAVNVELDNRGIDDISITFHDFKSTNVTIDAISEIDNQLIEKFEPRINVYSRVTNELAGTYRSCRFIVSTDEDTWFNGLVIDSGSLPNTSEMVALGHQLASVLLVEIGDVISVDIQTLNLSRSFVICGIVHEIGQASSMLCISHDSILKATGISGFSNYLGIKLIREHVQNNELVTNFALDIEHKFPSANVITPKIAYSRPILEALENSHFLLTILFCCSLLSAFTATYSLVTISIYEVLHEVGVLYAIGFSKNQIKRIFFYIPLVIGPIGILFSLIFSIGTFNFLSPFLMDVSRKLFLNSYQNIISEFGLSSPSSLQIRFSLSSLVVVALGFFIVILAGAYPSIKGTSGSPQMALCPRVNHSKEKKSLKFVIPFFIGYVILNLFGGIIPFSASLTHFLPILATVSAFLLMISILRFLFSSNSSNRNSYGIVDSSRFAHFKIAFQSIKSNSKHITSNIIAIALCLLLVILSSTAAMGIRYQQTPNVYMRLGGDIQISGISNESIIDSLKDVPNVRKICPIRRSSLAYTYVNNVSEIPEDGEIISYFITGVDYQDVVKFDSIDNNTIETAAKLLTNPSSLIISTNLARFLCKEVGESVSISLADISEIGIVSQISRNFTISSIVDNMPGIPSKNPGIFLSPQIIESTEIYEIDRILIGLDDSTKYEEVIKQISMLTDSFYALSAEEELNAYTERFVAISKLLNLVMFVTITSILLIVGTTQISKIITNRYVYGILKSVGFTSIQIYGIIFFESLIIILMGFIGGLICISILYFPLILGELLGYPTIQVPFIFLGEVIPMFDFLIVCIPCLFSIIITTLIAVMYLRKKNLVDLIKNEMQ